MPRTVDPRVWLQGLSLRRQFWSMLGGTLLLALVCVVLLNGRADVSLSLVFLVFFAAVVAIAAAGGPIVGVSAAIAAFLLANFFFTSPQHTFDVADPETLVELLIFLAVAMTVATLVNTSRRRLDVIVAKSAEAERLGAANDLRANLLRAVSHDLRTPLATAKMATSSLQATDVDLPAELRDELVSLADREVDRLVRIVDNLLDASRLQAGVVDVTTSLVRLDDLIRSAIAGIAGADRAQIDVEVAGDENQEVLTDPALMERVLVNLISNARRADPSGRVRVIGHEADGRPVIEVIDHGPGLPDEARSSAFEPFQRFNDNESTPGIGLGLSICRGFGAAVGADVKLLETPGGGLTARLSFPTVERGMVP